MGMSTHAVGFRQADERWNQMKAVWEACEVSGTAIPIEVEQFFNSDPPEDKPGMEVPLDATCCFEFSSDDDHGYEIDVSKLPKDVKFIRVYNSW